MAPVVAGPIVLPALVRREREEIGGTATYVISLERELRSRGLDVMLIGHGAGGDDPGFRSILPRDRALGRHFTWALWRRRGRWDFPPETILHLQRPDHVPAFSRGPWPIVLTFHGRHRRSVALRGGPVAGAVYRKIEERACRRADAVVFVSRADRGDLLRDNPSIAARSHVIPVGVDRDLFRPGDRGEARSALGLPRDAKAVGYAGRLAKEKNVAALIRAVERTPGVELWIAGDGPLLEDCRRIAGDRVRFLGRIDRRTMPAFLSACDVIGLSSHHEGLPTVVLEAWACGTPVIAPAVGDVPDLLGDGDGGSIAPSLEPETLSREIGSLIGRVAGGDNAMSEPRLRARTKPFGWPVVADCLIDVYARALASRRESIR